MIERARVLEIHEYTATLQCIEDTRCDGCTSLLCTLKTRTFEATVIADVPVQAGDEVRAFAPPSRTIVSGFFVLIFPLLLFVGGYLAIGSLGSEGIQVAAGFSALLFGFGLVYLIGRHRHNELPRIVQVLSASDIAAAQTYDTSV